MILFLLLLHIIVLQAVPNDPIDWTRCEHEARCFIEGKCTPLYSDTYSEYYSLIDFTTKVEPRYLINERCDIGVQILPFSSSKILIYMQVKGEILKTDSIGLYQNDKIIVGCRAEGKEGKVKLLYDPIFNKKKNLAELYEDISRFERGYALCAVTIDKFKKIPWDTIIRSNETKLTQLKFESANPKPRPAAAPPGTYGVLPYSLTESIFSKATTRLNLCDPSTIKPIDNRFQYQVHPLKDPSQNEMTCDNYKNYFKVDYDFQLIIQQGTNETEAKKLICDKTNKEYIGETATGTQFTFNQADFYAFCRTEISKTCKNPLSCPSSDDCPTFSHGNSTNNATLVCPDGKWFINNEYYDGIEAKCVDNEEKPNEARFKLENGSRIVTDFSNAQCFKEYDCQIMNHLSFSSDVNVTMDTISCTGKELRIFHGSSNFTAPKFICDKATGKWISNSPEKIALKEDSRVFCLDTRAAPQDTEKEGQLGDKIGIGFGAFFAALVPFILIYCLCYGRKKIGLKIKIDLKRWKSMKSNERIALAAQIFGDASLATPSSTVRIIHGLELIEIMLQSETEDPAVWEFAYPFLNRVHGASRTRGNHLTGLFTRYMYLEAKKIIDKHGWISPNRITRYNYKGYIRTVAIRLIFYCRFNDYTEEVNKFIGEGFEKLRFNCIEQYPHCGVLWSHVAVTRVKVFEQQFYDEMCMMAMLQPGHKDRHDIPEADRFPEIGNICEQAATAVGNSLKEQKTSQKVAKDLTSDCALGMAYIRGLLISAQIDMGALFRRAFVRNVGGCPELVQAVTEEKMEPFLEKMMRVLASYGQIQDARIVEISYYGKYSYRTLKLTFPELKKYDATERYKQINREQRLFEKALSDEAKEILSWLAARMDKKELRNPKIARTHANRALKGEDANFSLLPEPPKKNATLSPEEFFNALIKEQPVIPRIRTCQVNEEEQKKYRNILTQIFEDKTIVGLRVNFDPNDVLTITSRAMDIIRTEPVLIEDVPAGITVLTDLHGQLYDLNRVFEFCAKDGKPGYECTKYLFCGDYVDRGDQQLEILMALFILKILYPDRFFLLRGNHEFVYTNGSGGFFDEMNERFGETLGAKYIFARLNECFDYLSIAGIIGNRIICVHGGISLGAFTRYELRRLKKPLVSSSDDPLVHDMVWSDPALELKGICSNDDRSTSVFYGEDEFMHAMENVGCDGMIRGHLKIQEGFKVVWDRLFCVFTATATDDSENEGGFAVIDEDMGVHLHCLAVDRNRLELEMAYYKGARKKDCGDMGNGITVYQAPTV